MSLRPKGRPPRREFDRDHFHGRAICKRCSAEVHDWSVHREDHRQRDAEIAQLKAMISAFITGDDDPGEWTAEQVPTDPTLELRYRANAEGNAVTEASFLRGGLRQVRDVFRLRPPARMGLAGAVLAVLLSGCQVHGWAHRDCSAHGGLDYVAQVGTVYTAVCNDGTQVPG